MNALFDDLLRVGDDDIEVGIIERIQRDPCIVEEVELDILVEYAAVFGRYDQLFFHRDDLSQGL